MLLSGNRDIISGPITFNTHFKAVEPPLTSPNRGLQGTDVNTVADALFLTKKRRFVLRVINRLCDDVVCFLFVTICILSRA